MPNKQEEIREGIRGIEIEWYGQPPDGTIATHHRTFVAHLLDYLHSQRVVIKVDRDTTDFIKCPCDDCTAEHKLIDEWGYFCDLTCGQRSHWISRCRGRDETLEAGSEAVEPLLDEKVEVMCTYCLKIVEVDKEITDKLNGSTAFCCAECIQQGWR